MTIALPWYAIPIALVLAGVFLPMTLKQQGDYDMVTSLFQLGLFLLFVAAAIAFCLGRWLT